MRYFELKKPVSTPGFFKLKNYEELTPHEKTVADNFAYHSIEEVVGGSIFVLDYIDQSTYANDPVIGNFIDEDDLPMAVSDNDFIEYNSITGITPQAIEVDEDTQTVGRHWFSGYIVPLCLTYQLFEVTQHSDWEEYL